MEKRSGEGLDLWFGILTLMGGGLYKYGGRNDSVNTGGRAEVMLTKTLETGGGGLRPWSSTFGLDADKDREATMGSG